MHYTPEEFDVLVEPAFKKIPRRFRGGSPLFWSSSRSRRIQISWVFIKAGR
jgi:hypothetical protein